MNLFGIFIAAVLGSNVVLMRFLALCPFIGMSQDEGKAVGMGLAVTFVTVLATAVTWPLYHYVLVPLNLDFLKILAFILIIASLVQLVEFYLKKAAPALYASMGIYLALITTNCAILAVTFDNISAGYSFIQALVYALGAAIGFMIALLLMAGIRRKMQASPVPGFLKGAPIIFIAAALLSMAFSGFSGLGN
jgi:electron transport complex protein RnfA